MNNKSANFVPGKPRKFRIDVLPLTPAPQEEE